LKRERRPSVLEAPDISGERTKIRQENQMWRTISATVAIAIVLAATAATACAFEGGGRIPSEAPTIGWGQHYTAQLNNHKDDSNYNGDQEVAFWRLPPVSTHDQIVVNWHGLPFSHSSGFPVCMILAQGINDYNWGSTFGSTSDGYCPERTGVYRLSGSGTAATSITIQSTDSADTYLEFFAESETTEPARLETFPYDFSVEAPRHYLNLTIPPFTEVTANGIVHASVTGANGLPAPDGLIYGLTVRWHDGGIATYAAPSIGGQVAFQLALPESALKQSAGFIVGRGADAEYQAVESPVLKAKVTPPVLPAPSSACKKATSHAHALARQHHRLQSHARRARRFAKRKLNHRARHAARELRSARSAAASACATP
jgi:hypothetical protein